MHEKILQEFSGLTNNAAYVKIFSERMMAPVPNRTGEFLGTDQRLDFLPFLHKAVATVPENGQIFDVGAGAGDVVDYALQYASHGVTINIEEPNSALIKSYVNRVVKYPHLKTGVVYEGPLQDYYEAKSDRYPKEPQNLVLAIHMIYHLTDFTQPEIDAENDLIKAISFLYGLLTPGGSLFLVYADLLDSPQGEAVCGIAEKFFRAKYPHAPFADHLRSIYQARNQLLGPGGSITHFLSQRYPKTTPRLYSEKKESHFFGKTKEDIAVLALATELCVADDHLFDLTKLEFCLDYVSRYPERIHLQKETREVPQKGYWRANEPQIIATITKFCC